MIVVDASVLLELILSSPRAPRLAARLFDPAESLHVPHLLDVEVLHAVRRYTLAGELEASEGQQALRDVRDLPLHRHAHLPLMDRIWELRQSITAYDATNIALAEALGAPLLTCDVKLARAHGHHAKVELL